MDTDFQPVRTRLIRGTYFALLRTIFTVVGHFTVSIILARLLGASGVGTYTLYAVLGAVLVPLISLSIPIAVTKFTAEMRERNPRRLSTLLSSALIILLIVAGFGGIFVVLVV